MKKLTMLFLLIAGSMQAIAQQPYCCTTPGKVLTYTQYDAKGKETSTTQQIYKEVSGSDGNYDITIETKVKIGRRENSAETVMIVRDGNVQLTVGGNDVEVTTSNPELLNIPVELSVGQQLPLGDLEMKAGPLKVTSTITENEVIESEELTTPAGTFECFVVKQTSTGRVMGITTETITKTWYARGIGTVKTETYTNGNLASSSLLTEMSE